ncbi:MAG TPA: hypothetical protein VKI17_07305, partial [Gemmataceae bacterium]|nr:hypothetical protein [Gemmataceae bacterium]
MVKSQAQAFVLSTFGLLAILACLQSVGVAQEKAAQVKKETPAKKAEAKKEDAKKDEAKKEDAKKEEKKAEKVEVVIGQAAPAVAVQAVAQAVPPPPAGPVPAPPGATPAPADNELEGLALPKDRDVKKRLDAAELDYIPKKQWPEAVRFLQSVLDRKEDVFVQVKSKGPDGKERTSFVSARGEADRLIGKMDAEGWDTYELQYGGLAKGKLAEYKKSADPQVLHEVVQRYFHTAGGAEAADLLATYKLDRGETLEAAQIYERLLNRHGSDQLGGLTLFKAALAFRLSGNQIDTGLFPKTWKLLAAKVGSDGLQIGDDAVSLTQLQKEVDNAKPGELVGTRSWALFRGDTRRLNVGSGSAPFLENKWHRSMIELTQEEGTDLNANTRTRIVQALQFQSRRPEPMLPAFLPVATGGKLIYRTYLGIHAVNMQTGTLEWVSQTAAGLDALCKDTNKKPDLDNWFLLYQQSSNQNIIFENSVVGTLSTDNTRVYAVDDLGVPPHPNAMQGGPWGWNGGGVQMSAVMSRLAERSRLVAIDLETGKLVWERGDPGEGDKEHDKSELAGSYFLGPPLPLA